MNAITPQLVPPILLWLVKRQRELGGPVPSEELARELRCHIRDLPKVQRIMRKQGWVWEAVVDVERGRLTDKKRWYTGRRTLAETEADPGNGLLAR